MLRNDVGNVNQSKLEAHLLPYFALATLSCKNKTNGVTRLSNRNEEVSRARQSRGLGQTGYTGSATNHESCEIARFCYNRL